MKFEYKDYQLELDVTLDKEGSIYWKATCDKLSNFSFCFSPGLFRSLEGAISKFKQEVDRFLTINEIEAKKNMEITCVYKSYSLEITKEEDSEYFKCELIGNVFSKPRKITNESLEIVLAFFKSHVDNFNTGVSDFYMELNIEEKDQKLTIYKYDPNINKVLNYKTNYHFIPRLGTEDRLDNLVSQFHTFVNSEGDKNSTIELNGKKVEIVRTKQGLSCYPCIFYGHVQADTVEELKIKLNTITEKARKVFGVE